MLNGNVSQSLKNGSVTHISLFLGIVFFLLVLKKTMYTKFYLSSTAYRVSMGA